MLLRAARRALAAFEAWVGEYPYPTLDVARSAAGYALESPALVWVPLSLRRDVASFVVHEVAHQWFYGVVGSDQVAEPFADEAVTEFLTLTLTGGFRGSDCPKARLDLSVYAYSSDCYVEVIYVQGPNFLEMLRRDIGDAAFWDALSTYYHEGRYDLHDPATAGGVPCGGGRRCAATVPRAVPEPVLTARLHRVRRTTKRLGHDRPGPTDVSAQRAEALQGPVAEPGPAAHVRRGDRAELA